MAEPLPFKLVMDNVHGHIRLSPLAEKIINTTIFKRLKGIHQLQGLHEVFPTANHKRFEHSLGTMHLARRLCQSLKVSKEDTELVAVAGLCHDLGHGPFSHLWEAFVREQGGTWNHEESSFKMLLLTMEENPDIKLTPEDLTFIKELICGGDEEKIKKKEYPYKARGTEHFFLYEIISNKKTGIDVDKMDYMARDSRALGVPIMFDFDRFVEAGEPIILDGPLFQDSDIIVKRVAVRDKVVRNVQHLYQDRTNLHSSAYQHKTSTVFDRMYLDLWGLADRFITVAGRDGRMLVLSEAHQDEVALARLTDDWLHQTIRNSTSGDLEPARDLLRRIDQRQLYKIVAHIENTAVPEEACSDELKKLSSTPEILAVVKVKIQMGKGGRNPVEKMLFYEKGSLTGKKKTPEELKRFVPQEISHQELLVLSKE